MSTRLYTVKDKTRKGHVLLVASSLITGCVGYLLYIPQKNASRNLFLLDLASGPSLPSWFPELCFQCFEERLVVYKEKQLSSLRQVPKIVTTTLGVALDFTRNFEVDVVKPCFSNIQLSYLLERSLVVSLVALVPIIVISTAEKSIGSNFSRYRTAILNAAQFFVLSNCWFFNLRAEELLVAPLMMMASFDVFQRALEPHAKNGDESNGQVELKRSSIETDLTRNSSVSTGSPTKRLRPFPKAIGDHGPTTAAASGASTLSTNAVVPTDVQVSQLRRSLTELKTTNKAKDLLLRTTREELKTARETLNETFAEYAKVRDEIKTVKQKMSREHQAVVYRKDIELFALRKGNEQKENYIKDHDAKLDEVFKQQKATLELKDVQLKMLKERIAYMDRQNSPRFSQDAEHSDGDQALEVRLLRIKKGKANEEKDATISKLEEQLALAKKAAGEVVSQQGELQRAWEVVKKVQASLREERDLHAQTKDQLQEMNVRLEEETSKNSQSIGRLPTIEEDRHELESMFDAAQEDNLRLYAEVEMLEKRLREANSRMFAAEQEADSLKGQVKLEKAISNDLESASPSVVHRVHFQRMEAQLIASQEELEEKEGRIRSLQIGLADKDRELRDLRGEVDAAVSFHTQDQDEIESLRKLVVELQATKEQLMRDHERLASQRTRQRLSLPAADHTSARSSGATLIQELSPPLTDPSDEPLPTPTPTEALPATPEVEEAERASSIQETPKRHLRSDSVLNRWSLMSHDQPPAELRHTRRKSLGVKDFMKRMVKKDVLNDSTEVPPLPSTEPKQNARPRTAIVSGASRCDEKRASAALSVKDKNALLRPRTATVIGASAKPATPSPFETSSVPLPENIRPITERRNTPRYYATEAIQVDERPKTKDGEKKRSKEAGDSKSSSRLSWGATNKLKRRSLF